MEYSHSSSGRSAPDLGVGLQRRALHDLAEDRDRRLAYRGRLGAERAQRARRLGRVLEELPGELLVRLRACRSGHAARRAGGRGTPLVGEDAPGTPRCGRPANARSRAGSALPWSRSSNTRCRPRPRPRWRSPASSWPRSRAREKAAMRSWRSDPVSARTWSVRPQPTLYVSYRAESSQAIDEPEFGSGFAKWRVSSRGVAPHVADAAAWRMRHDRGGWMSTRLTVIVGCAVAFCAFTDGTAYAGHMTGIPSRRRCASRRPARCCARRGSGGSPPGTARAGGTRTVRRSTGCGPRHSTGCSGSGRPAAAGS